MAYTVMGTQVAGYVVLASDWNEMVNNFIAMAPDVFTTDGDIYIASGSNTGARLGAFTSSTGDLKRIAGGLEIDSSPAATGDTLVSSDGTVWAIATAMSQAQAEAGTETLVRGVTAERIKQAIANLSGSTEASKAELEAESAVAKYVPPDLLKNSRGVAKVWCVINATGTLQVPDYNVDSVSDIGTGDWGVVIGTDFSGTTYSVGATAGVAASHIRIHEDTAVGSVGIGAFDVSDAREDIGGAMAAWGDQ